MITDGFRVGNGLKQADGLAPNVFNIALKYAIRLLSVQVKFTIFYISLQLIGYADDINIMEGRKVLFVKYMKSRERERAKEAAQHQCQKTNTVVQNRRTRKVSEMLTVKGCGTE